MVEAKGCEWIATFANTLACVFFEVYLDQSRPKYVAEGNWLINPFPEKWLLGVGEPPELAEHLCTEYEC